MTLDELYQQYGTPVSVNGCNYKFICPVCKKRALNVNISLGLYNCLKCGLHKGKLALKLDNNYQAYTPIESDFDLQLDIVKKIIDSGYIGPLFKALLNTRLISNPTKYGITEIPTNIHAWLVNQGFTTAELIDSGLFYQGAFGLMNRLVLEPGRLLIPFWQENTIATFQTRVDPIKEMTVEGMSKYLSPTNSKIGSKVWYKNLTYKGDLIYTEGAFKAIVATNHGFDTCAITGINCWKSSSSELVSIGKRYKRKFVILDTDPDFETRTSLINAALGIYALDPKHTAIRFLPQINNRKQALDDYLLKYNSTDLEWELEYAWVNRAKIIKELKKLV